MNHHKNNIVGLLFILLLILAVVGCGGGGAGLSGTSTTGNLGFNVSSISLATTINAHTQGNGDNRVIGDCAISPDGKTFVTAGWDKTVKIWDANTSTLIKTISNFPGRLMSVSFHSDGRTLLCSGGATDADAFAWTVDTTTGAKLQEYPSPKNGYWTSGVLWSRYSPDEQNIAICTYEKLRIFKIQDSTVVREISILGAPSTFEFARFEYSPDNTKVAIAENGSSNTTIIRIVDLATGDTLQTLSGNKYGIVGYAFTKDGKSLFTSSGGYEDQIKLWDLGSGTIARKFNGHAEGPAAFELSIDEKYLLTGSSDKTFKVWDVSTGNIVKDFVDGEQSCKGIAVSYLGKYVLTVNVDGKARIYR